MARLSERDQETVVRLAAETQTIHLNDGSFWKQFLPQLNEALRARVPMAYGVRLTEEGPRLSFLETLNTRLPADAVESEMNRGLARLPASDVAFNPARPTASLRNLVKHLAELRHFDRAGNIKEIWPAVGIEGHDQLRVLVCESETLLAWVGVYRPAKEPFTARERMMLQRLVPALRQRLTLEQQLASAPLARAALETCIETLARPAMVVNWAGRPQFANTLARRLAATNALDLTRRLQECIAGRSAAFELTRLKAPGLGPHYLAVEAAPARDPKPLLHAATAQWSLTPREAEALQHLADGLSNRAISVHLACGERTVEVHVARLLQKSGSESRSQLIARFWNGGHLEHELRT